MSRGFVSFLFLLALAPIVLLSQGWPSPSSPDDFSLRILSLRRLEIETNIDTIIRDELFAGARTTIPPDVIQANVNARIIDYFQQFSSVHRDSIHYSSGFSLLTQTNYLSLFSQPLLPLSFFQLQSSSHVLVLPVSQTERYAEYSYTGGPFGASVLHSRLHAHDANTLFALPPGYRVCVTSFQKDWPCVERG